MNSVNVENLVLRVKPSEDAIKITETYDAFLNLLFDDEFYFLKDAAYQILHYLFTDQYRNLADLGKQNFEDNAMIAKTYSSLHNLITKMQLPEKKSCSVDLATGTGKAI